MHWKYNRKRPWDVPQIVLQERQSGPHPCGSGLAIQNYTHLKHLYHQQGEQRGHHTGHNGGSHKAWLPFLLLVSLGYQWPCSTASCCCPRFPASWPLRTTREFHASSLHTTELRENKQYHIWPNKYIIAHYKLAKIPNAAPTKQAWLHTLTAFKSLQF